MSQGWKLQSRQILTTPRWQILRGGKAPDCAIAADFVDAGIPMAKLCDNRVLDPGDVDYARDQAGHQRWKGSNEAELAPQPKASLWVTQKGVMLRIST